MPRDRSPRRDAAGKEEPPPFLGTWNRLYAVIAVYTLVLVLVLRLTTVLLNR